MQSSSQESHLDISPPITLEAFLADIEKKAFHFALLATGAREDALDLVQEAMIKLVSHYQNKDAGQWKALFYKILQNKIRDYHRHQKVKKMVFFWKTDTQEGELEWLTKVTSDGNQGVQERQLIDQQLHARVMSKVRELSTNQQQCFLLRSWEGLSVAETAEIMQCSQGSIKTHYSRAIDKLQSLLEADDDFQR